MKIELIKEIKLFELEFIGEVDFFEESPYIKLLENIKNKDELIIELESKDMPESAINNIIKRLKNLKVIKQDRTIENLKDGFPEREYGKYVLDIFINPNNNLPFKYKNRNIKREKVISKNRADNIKIDEEYLKIVQTDKDNKKFKINSIENDKGIFQLSNKKEKFNLTIKYQNNDWSYNLDNKNYSMEKIQFIRIFNDWSEEDNSLKITFSEIKHNKKFIKEFLVNKQEDEVEIDEYGKFKIKYENIPTIPKTEYDAKEWFLFILKDKIKEINRYISKDELFELWENLKEQYPKFLKFDLTFDFETILKKFGKNSKYYWLLKAGEDLYPFNNDKIKPISRIFIENGDFKNKFNFKIKSLIIIDRYINTLRHFKILEKILNDLGKPDIKIHTMKIYKENEKDKINKIIDKNNIKRIVKTKKELPHKRYWIFNNQFIYMVPDSLDGIDNSTFNLYDKEDIKKIEPILYNIIAGEIL